MLDDSGEVAHTYIVYNEDHFIAYLNRPSLFEFRYALWMMATLLPFHEDISLCFNGEALDVKGVFVGYCEFVLVEEDASVFGKAKKNGYLYRPENKRADFAISRAEAASMFGIVNDLCEETIHEHEAKLLNSFFIQII